MYYNIIFKVNKTIGYCATDLSIEQIKNTYVTQIQNKEEVLVNGSWIGTDELFQIQIFQSNIEINNTLSKMDIVSTDGLKKPWINYSESKLWRAIYKGQDVTNNVLSDKHIPITNEEFISTNRIKEIEEIVNAKFDTSRLVQYLKEINFNYVNGNIYSTAMLLRATIDHIPPIFSSTTFNHLISQYGSQSFKENMQLLQKGLRKISDLYMHNHIRSKEKTPEPQQIEYRSQIDLLLQEILVKLNEQ